MNTNTTNNNNTTFNVLEAFFAAQAHINERPGFCLSNYSSAAQYRADLRRANAQKKKAKKEFESIVKSGYQFKLACLMLSSSQGRLYRDEEGEARWAGHVYGYGPVERWDGFLRLIEQAKAEAA